MAACKRLCAMVRHCAARARGLEFDPFVRSFRAHSIPAIDDSRCTPPDIFTPVHQYASHTCLCHFISIHSHTRLSASEAPQPWPPLHWARACARPWPGLHARCRSQCVRCAQLTAQRPSLGTDKAALFVYCSVNACCAHCTVSDIWHVFALPCMLIVSVHN